jgi:hypothetical protein
MKKRFIFLFLISLALLIGCSKEETFEEFFPRTLNEMHKGEENYSYSIVLKEFNVVHENDAIAIFIDNKNKEETILITYYEKENGNWYWRRTTGTRWDSPIRWSSMNQVPYIYLGAINDNSITEVYAGKIPATIVEVEGDKRIWYAISATKDVEVKVVKGDGTYEIVEQTQGEGWIKKEY